MSDEIKTLEERALDYAEFALTLNNEDRERAKRIINQAVMAGMPDDEVGKPPVSTLGEYLDTEIELPPMLVEPGLVARGAISAMVSRGGKGKTAVSLNRLIRWSMGKPLFDEQPELMKPVEPLRCLIIENEGAPGHFQKIMRTILYAYPRNEKGARDGDDFFTDEEKGMARDNIHIWGDGGWSGLKFDREEDFSMIDRAVGTTKADIVFVEPFQGLWQGDENSASEMKEVLDRMSELANRYSCGIMLTHHERKSGAGEGEGADQMSAMRGSTALEGVAAVLERWVPVKGGKHRELRWIKNRFDEAPPDVRMEFDRDMWGFRYVAENEGEREAKGALSRYPGQWMSGKDVAEELEENYTKVMRWLSGLVDSTDQPVKSKTMEGKRMFRYTGGDTNDDQLVSI